MATKKPSNSMILEELKNGVSHFEIVSSPSVTSIATSPHWRRRRSSLLLSNPFFARIGTQQLEVTSSPALSKVESFKVHRVTGDGRCMFRALVKGMAMNKSLTLSPRQETDNADELRMAIKEVLCDNEKERHQYEEALIAITVDEPLKRYCQRIARPDFWGGESELLVLSKLCRQPIVVYIPEHEETMFVCPPLNQQEMIFGCCTAKGRGAKMGWLGSTRELAMDMVLYQLLSMEPTLARVQEKEKPRKL